VGLGELAVRVAELAEAEGRLARRAIFRLAAALLALLIVFALVVGGVAMLAVAGFMALTRAMPTDAALALLGAALLIVAGLSAGWARQLSQPERE
jgi:hypothetical protein